MRREAGSPKILVSGNWLFQSSVSWCWPKGTWALGTRLVREWTPFSSPEAALLLVSTKNRDLWPSPTPEVRDSRTSRHSAHVQSQVWQIWLVLVSIYCVFKAIQKRNVVGPGQRSRFLVLTKRSAASGDENGMDAWRRERSIFSSEF